MSFPRILIASAFALSVATSPGFAKAPPPKPDPVKGESMDDRHKDMISAQSCDTLHAKLANGVASDPEEGGQIARKAGGAKTHVGDMQVTKLHDTASTKLMDESAPPVSNCH